MATDLIVKIGIILIL
jgi:hypothetical protein